MFHEQKLVFQLLTHQQALLILCCTLDSFHEAILNNNHHESLSLIILLYTFLLFLPKIRTSFKAHSSHLQVLSGFLIYKQYYLYMLYTCFFQTLGLISRSILPIFILKQKSQRNLYILMMFLYIFHLFFSHVQTTSFFQ